ncbi:helix-turn-helix transcriptional regulator [uncultured Oscillibacter sp.]|uniref:helix-turn-helix transcriptional regulator n=1 Tax=uncultured Oscillibacter sp. TaxID=876091 RepID=UPI0025D51285|nr:AraC family transcriptional regulator [uncultured Oscillibacter sp.]
MQQKISTAILNSNQPLNRQIIRIDDPHMRLHVYWIFLRSGRSDILLSERNKHSFYELQLMLEGYIRQSAEVGGSLQLYTVEQGNFMIVPPNHYHQVIEASQTGIRFSVAFQIESTDPYVLSALEEIRRIAVFPAPEAADTYVELMLAASRGGSPWAAREISNLLQCLLLRLMNSVLPEGGPIAQRDIKPGRAAQMMAEIQTYIADHIGDGITVEDVAASLNRSSRQLNRICRSQSGKTLNQLIGAEKLNFIKELIGTSTLSFAEIAAMSGFSSEYALNRFFKYAEGYTLGQYRRLATLS